MSSKKFWDIDYYIVNKLIEYDFRQSKMEYRHWDFVSTVFKENNDCHKISISKGPLGFIHLCSWALLVFDKVKIEKVRLSLTRNSQSQISHEFNILLLGLLFIQQ